MGARSKARFVIAGDIGGTKTLLRLVAAAPPDAVPELEQHYASAQYHSLEALLQQFLREPAVEQRRNSIGAACFSVAGPVNDQRSKLTNLDWNIDAAALAASSGIARVQLVNDFEAAAIGVAELPQQDFVSLQTGTEVAGGVRVVLGAGTGMGVATLTWSEGAYVVHASEGGHADFAPIDETQDGLLRHLRKRFGRVSCERVVSGSGLVNIFGYLQVAGQGQPCAQLAQAMREQDPAAAIAEFASSRRDVLAQVALELFVSAYGAFAGNLALIALARGGVYIAGGIAPKIAAQLEQGGFMRAFTAKGRFASLMATLPVNIVMNEKVGVVGAAAMARRL